VRLEINEEAAEIWEEGLPKEAGKMAKRKSGGLIVEAHNSGLRARICCEEHPYCEVCGERRATKQTTEAALCGRCFHRESLPEREPSGGR
jgi:hypothetical protein